MPLHKTKTFTLLAGAALAASLIVAPVVTAGATAADPVDVTESSVSDKNKVEYWENEFSEYEAQCYKHEGNDLKNNAHGTVTPDGKGVILNEFNPDWPGNAWVALIIKAGTANNVVEFPKAGVRYESPSNGNNQAEVSHWIVCKGEKPAVPVAVTPTLTHADPTCDAAGTVTKSDNAVWTSKAGENGATIWTAAPKQGQAFTDGAKTEWTVPKLDKLTGDACLPPVAPEPEVKTEDSSEFDCESTTVVTTTVTTTTPYVREGDEWVLGEPTSETTTAERDMTADEIAECPATSTPTPIPTPTPTPSTTPVPAALAATGGGVSPIVPLAGGAALLMGLAAIFFVAARRRQGA